MNKKLSLLLLGAIALTGCAKTERLYTENQYNSPVFDENYYTDWEGINNIECSSSQTGLHNTDTPVQKESDPVKIGGVEVPGYTWGGLKEEQFGYAHNLSKTEKKFNYGVTSKLFDGRVRCEGYYQKSRVQVDKSGFAMYFPKALKQAKYLAFACRGGTDYPAGQEFRYSDLKIDVEWSFYIHVNSTTYSKVTYKLNQIAVPVDNGGNTAFICMTPYIADTFDELYDATAMSFTWSVNDPEKMATRPDLTDDFSQKEKHHLALMLYEEFIGDSIWG